jgi:DNA-binding NarL/FixJ family response regulator
MAVSILLFEDNDLLRESIRNMLSLSDSHLICGDFKDAMDSEQHVRKYNPQLILMDIDLPGITGIEAVKRIRKFNKEVAIIMLTVFDDNQHVFDAICAGASGYLLKKHISSKLYAAIEEVLEGGAPMSPSIARMVIGAMHQKDQPADHYQLTAREKEILTSLSKGNSYKLIGADLGISIDTVRTHIKKIYEKLHVHSQTEAVSKAINEKLV